MYIINFLRVKVVLLVLFTGGLFWIESIYADLQISVNNSVRLKAFSNLGIPLHPDSGNRSVSNRLPDGTVAIVEQIDEENKWMKILGGGKSGWIIRKYVAEVLTQSDVTQPNLNYVIGTWNIEHFHDGAKRGFPENTMGGESYLPRTQNDYETIAAIIEILDIRILALQEVYAQEVDENGDIQIRSQEVDKLIDILGANNYDYFIGESGRSQHIAILYDKRYVRLNAICECEFPDERVNGKNLFDRQPLFGHFTFLDAGQPKNDLVVVGVHLASGQNRAKNHDRAMNLLVEELVQARTDSWCIPPDENDIVIMGDLNANRFDNKKEDFWDQMENNGWDVLGDVNSTYSATRLSGNPLGLHNSKIDYIIVTEGNQGLSGEEIIKEQATVHSEIIEPDAVSFRRQASDHIPVTIEVLVMDDTDQITN